jgi:hypothetical protein
MEYIFNTTARYNTPQYDNVIIEWVDGVIDDNLVDDTVSKPAIVELTKAEKRKLEIKKKRAYYRVVNKLTYNINRETIPGYDADNILTHTDFKKGYKFLRSTDKLVIDHKISIIYGYRYNIPAEYIADISNLRYIPSCDNQFKSGDVFIDELNEWILPKQKNIL